ncbi:MAG: c-type cytochrome biogenesis protein CcmI [Gammaproteobacteria bacterium]|nr:c-type cytochrome biogenesis protein CcmI [Gammaproteobacteria bacterium]MDE0412047.1 c-type cytochrome biogenesis protein CcmI [Gammaproteobacteria bacterium]
MLVFWLICSLLLAAALLLILPPLLGKSSKREISHQSVNKAVFERKLVELEEDFERGLIDAEQLEAARTDLQRALIDDLEYSNKPLEKGSGRLLPVLILIAVPALSVFLYLKISNGLVLLSDDSRSMLVQQGDMSSTQQAIMNLERKLQADPANLEGWLMLGRSFMALGRSGQAVSAFERAYELSNGTDPDVMVAYAEAQVFASGHQFSREVMTLFTQALKVDPGHERALWFAGYAAYQLHDYESALTHWDKLLQQIPSGQEEARAALLVYLNDAKQKAMTQISAEQGVEQELYPNKEARGNASIVVQVSINESLQEYVQKSDTLFVYARAVNGPPMPLALVKMTAASLPATVTLDDSMAMIPGMTLSGVEQVEVIARISKSGKAIMQTGDLYGSAGAVNTQSTTPVTVLISTIAP